MNKTLLFVPFVAIGLISCDEKANPVGLTTQIDSVSYAIGLSIGGNLKTQKIENFSPDIMAQAIKDVIAESTLISDEEGNQIIQTYFQKKQMEEADKASREGTEFLEQNAKDPDVKTTSTGLQYKVIEEGTGARPTSTDTVTVHYTGTLINGDVFDSSVDRGEPTTFPLNGVIPGWTEGLQLMTVGSKYKFFIPADLAYGDRGAGGKIQPGATLIFDVELIAIGGQ
jgi:FKBP-type peptidyl-prolyl cis-trans isomerase FklB